MNKWDIFSPSFLYIKRISKNIAGTVSLKLFECGESFFLILMWSEIWGHDDEALKIEFVYVFSQTFFIFMNISWRMENLSRKFETWMPENSFLKEVVRYSILENFGLQQNISLFLNFRTKFHENAGRCFILLIYCFFISPRGR